MYILGIVKKESPRALIDPKSFESAEKLFEYLSRFFSKEYFVTSAELTLDLLQEKLSLEEPVIINFSGFKVSLILGKDKVIENQTDRYIHMGIIDQFLVS